MESANAASGGVGVNISAYNGTHQVVSGPIAEIEEISGRLESLGVRVRRLNTSRAFHSALMEPALDDLEAVLDRLSVEAPAVNFVSNLTGRALGADERLDGAYWRRHAREAVAFVDGVRTLDGLGVDLVIEIGPRAVLSSMTLSAWPESSQSPAPAVMASLRPPADGASANIGRWGVRGSGRSRLRDRTADSILRTVRGREPAQDFPAGLSVSTTPSLAGGSG